MQQFFFVKPSFCDRSVRSLKHNNNTLLSDVQYDNESKLPSRIDGVGGGLPFFVAG